MKRGTLTKEKGSDGTVYVQLDAHTQPHGDETSDQSPPDAILVEAMQDQIDILKHELEGWKEEARRKDTNIMTMAQCIPELEPTPEPPDARQTPGEGPDRVCIGARA